MNHKWQGNKYNLIPPAPDQQQTSSRPAADPQRDGGHLELAHKSIMNTRCQYYN